MLLDAFETLSSSVSKEFRQCFDVGLQIWSSPSCSDTNMTDVA